MWKMILVEMVGMLVVLYIATGSISGFLYIPILVLLLVVFVVVGGKHGLKGVGVSILVFIVNLVMFNAYYNFTCGPNSADVKVMKPMAEKISDYIVKHGIPKSLKDIPDLPYGLEGCERDKEFDYQENCKIENKMMNLYFKHGKYTIDDKIYEEANLEMRHVVNNTTKTGLLMEFEKKNNSFVQVDEVKIYSGKTDGICNSMRQ